MGKRRRRQWMRRAVELLGKLVAFQLTYYAWFFLWGLYAVFIASGPPLTLEGSMAQVSYQLFYAINIIGPTLGACGVWLEHKRFDVAAYWMQISGNFMFSGALLAYILATSQVESWGRGTYGAFPLGASALTSTLGLVLRDGLRLRLLSED